MKNFTKLIRSNNGPLKEFSTSSEESSYKNQCQLYKAKLFGTIKRFGEESKKAGKNSLILVGSSHGDGNSILAKSLLFQSAKDVGINSYFIEAAPQDATFLENGHLECNPHRIFYFFATKFLKFNPMFCDLDVPFNEKMMNFLLSPEGIIQRENNFCKAIKETNRNSIMDVGDFHLKELVESPILRNSFSILPIAINYTKTDLKTITAFEKERDDFLSQEQKILHLETPIFPNVSPWKILSLTLKNSENEKLIGLAKEGKRLSEDDLAQTKDLGKSNLGR